MKIFKNKVGRPSNLTIRNRRILCLSVITVIVLFISLMVINKDRIFNLKGATSNISIGITYDCDSVSGQNVCKKVGYRVVTNQNVKIKYRLGWGKVSGYTTQKTKNFGTQNLDSVKSLAVWVYDMKGKQLVYKAETFKQNGYPGRTYYYDQTDYQNVAYCGRALEPARDGCAKGNTICTSGCGGTSVAIALSTLTQNTKYNPEFISKQLAKIDTNGTYCGSGVAGTSGDGIKKVISSLGFNVKRMSTYANFWNDPEKYSSNKIKDEVKKALKNGAQIVINAGDKGCFTSTGHYLAIVGINSSGDKVYLYDPNNGEESYVKSSYCNLSGLRNGWWKIKDLLGVGGITYNGEYTVYIITKKEKKLTLNCPTKANVNQKVTCTVNQDGVNIRVAPEEGLSSGNPIFVTNISDMSKSFTYTKPTEVTVKATINKQTVTKKIKIVGSNNSTKKQGVEKTQKKLKDFNLTCPSVGYINEKFTCKTNAWGVKITLGGANSLASGYKSSFTTTLTDKTKDAKYTNKLFDNYKNLIKKDSKGKQYITAKITATKSGYKTVIKRVKIYKSKNVSTNKANVSKKTFTFTCPSTVTVGEKIVCTTNTVGVTIRTSNPEALVSGYAEKFVTTNYDRTKSLSYTKPGTYYVKASKAGYNEVKKTINVIAKTTNSSGSLVLTCPSTVYLNEPILCTTNMVGVTIRTSNPAGLASGISDKFVTNSTDLSKSLKYVKTGTYYVKASKAGYKDVVKTIVVKRRTTQTTKDNASLAGIWFNGLVSYNGKRKTIKITPTKYGSRVKYDSYVMCETYSDCINVSAWKNMENKYRGTQNPTTNRNAARINKTESLWINTKYNGIANKKYYVRITTYSKNNANSMIYAGVFEFAVDSRNNLKIRAVSNTYK